MSRLAIAARRRSSVVAQSLLYPAFAIVCGLLGGYQFPVASSIYFGAREGQSPGALYALDLAGSCLAALLISAWLVPVFGFLNAALLMALVSAAPVLSSLWSSRTPAP